MTSHHIARLSNSRATRSELLERPLWPCSFAVRLPFFRGQRFYVSDELQHLFLIDLALEGGHDRRVFGQNDRIGVNDGLANKSFVHKPLVAIFEFLFLAINSQE